MVKFSVEAELKKTVPYEKTRISLSPECDSVYVEK